MCHHMHLAQRQICKDQSDNGGYLWQGKGAWGIRVLVKEDLALICAELHGPFVPTLLARLEMVYKGAEVVAQQ